MKQGTVWLLSFGGLLFVGGLAFGIILNGNGDSSGSTFIIVGIIALVLAVLLSLKDIIKSIKSKRYEKDVLSGKIQKEVTRSYVVNRAKTSSEIASEKQTEESDAEKKDGSTEQ